ncbi:MAG: V-type ATPase subunit, partial [Chloroflexota bacterium]
RDLLFPLGNYSQLPVEDLLRSARPADTAEILADTLYGRVLRVPLERFHEEGSLFAVDVALDLDYYRRLWADVLLLNGLDRRLARQLIGVRYDLLNIDWLIRFRLLYHLSPQEIFNYTIPYGYRMTDQIVQHAAAAPDLVGIIAELPDVYAAVLRGVEAAEAPIREVEVRLQRHLNRQARLALVGYPFHIGEVIAYLWLREAEVHD